MGVDDAHDHMEMFKKFTSAYACSTKKSIGAFGLTLEDQAKLFLHAYIFKYVH